MNQCTNLGVNTESVLYSDAVYGAYPLEWKYGHICLEDHVIQRETQGVRRYQTSFNEMVVLDHLPETSTCSPDAPHGQSSHKLYTWRSRTGLDILAVGKDSSPTVPISEGPTLG